jgi:hypothetical protein
VESEQLIDVIAGIRARLKRDLQAQRREHARLCLARVVAYRRLVFLRARHLVRLVQED